MKKIFLSCAKATLFFSCLFISTSTLNAQAAAGTDDDGFVFRILTPANIAQDLVNGGECGWEGSLFGPSITEKLCGELVWADDSIACVPLTNDLTDKIAIIRRKTCNFSLKVYHAQLAGAKAVVIVNHYDAVADGPCTLPLSGMSGGDSAAAVTIPAIFVARQTGENFDQAIAAGETITACFDFPRMSNATAGVYHYSTPLSQVDTVGEGIMSVYFRNRGTVDLTNVVVKAEVIAPSGGVQTFEETIPLSLPNQEDTIDFPAYKPAAEMGKFTVLYTNSAFTDAIDSLYTYFEHTDYTFATDNLVIDPLGVGVSNTDFETGGFIIQNGGLCVTGSAGGMATHATFGIANADTLWSSAGDIANTVSILVYDADVDGDNVIDLVNGWADLAGGQVGFGSYIFPQDQPVDAMIDVPVYDFNTGTDPVTLKPNHAYYVSLLYDGTEAATSRCLRFSNTLDVNYAINLTTPLYVVGTLFSGWSGAEVIQRLQLEGFVSKTKEQKPLDKAKYTVTPNPANDVVRLDLNLDNVNDAVAVTLLDWNGRSVRTQTLKNFQNGQMTFNVSDLPSGYYLAWIRTSEGAGIAKLSICH